MRQDEFRMPGDIVTIARNREELGVRHLPRCLLQPVMKAIELVVLAGK